MTPNKTPDITEAIKLGARPDFSQGEDWTKTDNSDWEKQLSRTKEGSIKGTFANVCQILRYHPLWKGTLALNPFTQKIYWRREAPENFPARPRQNKAYEEQDSGWLALWLYEHFNFDIALHLIADAVCTIGHEHTFHPVKEYLHSLRWDGTPRLHTWAIRLLGAKDTPYTRAVSAKWMISAVARIERPGEKADCMLILEGDQGLLKSTTIKVLCRDENWFTDHLGEIGSKDTAQQLQGRWLIEFAELEHFDKTEVNRLKSFISQSEDSFRPPYGRQVKTFPRQCVFAGTSNGNEYLRDETGGRRFWPIACTRIDIEAIRAERDQLWAEARARYLTGEKWWLEDPAVIALAKEEQLARHQCDAWEDIIATELQGRESITVAEVLMNVFKLEKERWTQPDQNRVARILKKLGWRRRQFGTGKNKKWRYVLEGA